MAKPYRGINFGELKPSAVVYWVRVIFAVPTGLLSFLLKLSDWRALSFGIMMYLISYYIIRYGLNMDPNSVGGTSKLMTIGVGSFFMVWLAVLGLVNTFSIA